jgi:hypothetical protein
LNWAIVNLIDTTGRFRATPAQQRQYDYEVDGVWYGSSGDANLWNAGDANGSLAVGPAIVLTYNIPADPNSGDNMAMAPSGLHGGMGIGPSHLIASNVFVPAGLMVLCLLAGRCVVSSSWAKRTCSRTRGRSMAPNYGCRRHQSASHFRRA